MLNIDPSNAWQAWMRLHAVCVGAQWCVGGNHLRGGVRGHEALVLRRGALLEVAARTPCIMPVLRTAVRPFASPVPPASVLTGGRPQWLPVGPHLTCDRHGC